MTNTHITVGGHKVTTNKVGTVKHATLDTTYITGTKLDYCVVNGLCCFIMYISPRGAYSNVIICSNMPPVKNDFTYEQYVPSTSTGIRHLITIGNSGGNGVVKMYSGDTSNMYLSGCYPVADDWVES